MAYNYDRTNPIFTGTHKFPAAIFSYVTSRTNFYSLVMISSMVFMLASQVSYR